MSGTDRRVADLQLKQSLGRVELSQPRGHLFTAGSVFWEWPGFLFESLQARAHQRPDRFLDDQVDQIVRRVIAARSLAGEDVGPDNDLAIFDGKFMFEQALVYRAELPDAQIAIVDVAAPNGPCSNERASMTSAMT